MFIVSMVIFVMYLIFQSLYIIIPLLPQKPMEDKAIHIKNNGFSILVPAYNEEDVILNCVQSIINIAYKNFTAFIIDDGSTDNTLQILHDYLELEPIFLDEEGDLEYHQIDTIYQSNLYDQIYVIHKNNGGKADALNAGLACCRNDYVITLDADCMLREDAIDTLDVAFQNDMLIAAGGTVHITQSSVKRSSNNQLRFDFRNLIKYQVLHYLIAFYLHKYTQAKLNSLIVISGAFGSFKRSVLLDLKGYRNTVGEDMDITLRIHSYIKRNHNKYLMAYIPESVCYTECPENLSNLLKQRIRWQKAFVDCFMQYGKRLYIDFNPTISTYFLLDSFLLGTISTFCFLMLPTFILIYHQIDLIAIYLLAVAYVLGLCESVVALKISKKYCYQFIPKDIWRLIIFILVELLTYRLLNILFVVIGTIAYPFQRNKWNKVIRHGRSFKHSEEPKTLNS